MKNVMKKAWEISRNGQKKYGGKVKEYFAEALRMAWAALKNESAAEDVNANVNMNKVKAALKVELFELERSPKNGIVSNWVQLNAEKLIARAIEMLQSANASMADERNIRLAAFYAIDECH